jgi:hypothetical protein
VTHADARLRDETPDQLSDRVDRLHAIVNEEHLPAALKLELDGRPNN